MTWLRKTLALGLAVVLGGCSRPLAPPMDKPVEIDVSEYGRVFRAAMDELHDEGFSLDRREYRFGLLTTRPLPSPTILEPWKSLNATGYQALQATVTDQRRVVAVRIQPVDAATPSTAPAFTAPITQPTTSFRLSVTVTIEQAELADRRLSGSTSGPAIINNLHGTPAELRDRGIPGRYWQPVGRDPYLEHRILAAVVRRSIETPDTPGSAGTAEMLNSPPDQPQTAPGSASE